MEIVNAQNTNVRNTGRLHQTVQVYLHLARTGAHSRDLRQSYKRHFCHAFFVCDIYFYTSSIITFNVLRPLQTGFNMESSAWRNECLKWRFLWMLRLSCSAWTGTAILNECRRNRTEQCSQKYIQTDCENVEYNCKNTSQMQHKSCSLYLWVEML